MIISLLYSFLNYLGFKPDPGKIPSTDGLLNIPLYLQKFSNPEF